MDVDKLLSGESQTVEYKAQRLPRSKSYARTVVAFANVRGGTLVFGTMEIGRASCRERV